MVHLYVANVATAQDLLKTLNAATNGGNGYLDALWQLFLYQGQLYEVVSKGAATFTGLPICLWIINHFRNSQKTIEEGRLDTGDLIRYLILGMLIFGLFNPGSTSRFLYDSKLVAFSNAANVTAAARTLANDPVTFMASASAAERAYGEGVATCNRVAEPTFRTKCLEDAKKAAEDNKSLTDVLFGWVPDPLQVFTESLMLTFGTMFLLLLEVAQLICSLFLPYILLIAIADYAVLWGWCKAWLTAGLTHTAYNLCIISISFAMTQSNGTDTFLWAMTVGIGAPWLSMEIVSGSRFGIMQGMSAIAGKIVNAGR
jgi:hypothetical protein